MPQRVTIKSIARDLGISHMTVSRALANHPNVRAETRQAILARAQELGYVKNAAATAMRGAATGIVGLLLPNIVNEFYARFANALALHCEDCGLHLVTHLTSDDLARETQSLLRLRALQADSVVMVPAPGDAGAETLRLLQGLRVIQLIRRRADGPGATAILIEDTAPIAAAADHLASRGHRRIAYIGAHAALSTGRDRLDAFTSGLRRNGLPEDAALIRTAPPSFAMGQQALAAVLDAETPATALVCGGFEISNGALEASLRRNLRLPEDLAFVGYGDPAFYEWIQGGISTIALPVEALAARTAALALQDSPHPVSIPAQLVIRHSG